MRRQRLDLPLARTAPARLLPWLTAALVYLLVMLLGMATIADQALRAIDQRARMLIVTLPLVDPGDSERDLSAALEILYQEPFVLRAEHVSNAALRGLMAPWLGEARAGDLPLPGMIDVALDPLAEPDLAALQGALSRAVPGATLALDQAAPDPVAQVAALVRGWSGGFAVLALAALLVAIAAVTHLSLRLCADAVALLRWMGASPGYLAGQIERFAWAGGLRGGAAGFGLAVLTVVALIRSGGPLAVAGSLALGLRPIDWGLLAAIAVSAVVLAVALVRAAALWSLRQG